MIIKMLSDRKSVAIFSMLFVLTIMVGLVSCDHKKNQTHLPELSLIDELCDRCPDSANIVLQHIFSKTLLSESDRMYYELLRIKAANNLYEPQKDSTIFIVTDYFKTAKDKKLLCQAYYYLGKYYLQHHDAPQALEKFQLALELKDSDTPLTFLSKTYSQCGGLFYDQDMYVDALDMYKKSYKIDVRLKDTLNIVNGMRDMAQTLNKLNKPDSCEHLLKKAFSMALSTKDISLQQSVAFMLVGFYLDRGKVNAAHKIFSENFYDIGDDMKSPVYVMAANIYKKESKIDSCVFYCRKLMLVGTLYAKEYAARELLEYYLQIGDMKKCREYMSIYNDVTDSVRTVTATQSIAKMHSLYDYTLKEKENQRIKQASTERTYIFIIIFTILLAVILLFVAQNERKEKKCVEYSCLNEHLAALYDNASKEYSVEKEQMKNQISELEAKLEDLLSREHSQTENVEKSRVAIYDIINKVVNERKSLTVKDWKMIEQMMDKAYPNYKSTLCTRYNMAPREYRVCMLVKLGFINSDIATIMCRSSGAISLMRSNLYEKFFGRRGSAKDFDKFIKDL